MPGAVSVLVTFLSTPKPVSVLRVLVVAAARGARALGARVGRDVGAGAGRATRGGAATLHRLGRLGLGERHAGLAVGELLGAGLIDVEVGVDLDLRLVVAQGRAEHRVDRGLHLTGVASVGRSLAAGAGRAAGLVGRPQDRAGGVGDGDVLGLQALHGGGGGLRHAAHGAGRQRVGGVAELDGGRRRRRFILEEVVLRHDDLDRRVRDALDTAEGASDLALQRTLVGDLLLELRGAELGLVEQLVARLIAARRLDAGGGERDARLRHGRLGDRQSRAVVAQLVGDALLVERGSDLRGLRGIDARRDQRVARRRGDLEHDERDREDGDEGDPEDRLGLGRKGEKVLDEGRHWLGLRPGCGRCPERPRRPWCGSGWRAASQAARARRS